MTGPERGGKGDAQEAADSASAGSSVQGRGDAQNEEVPSPIVGEELRLLEIVMAKLDKSQPRRKTHVDDLGAMLELRDALAEAKPEDHASLLEQMHRIESLSKQRGKGESAPVDRKSPYFGHLRLEEGGRRRDVLIGQRGYVEPGGGVQIVDWRHAPVSRLFYRYEEGDPYEEQLGDRLVEGEVLARRTVTILDSELRRVAAPQGSFAREFKTGKWRAVDTRSVRLRVERDGAATLLGGVPEADDDDDGGERGPGGWPAKGATKYRNIEGHKGGGKDGRGAPAARLGVDADSGNVARTDRFLPSIAALIDPRQFELISRPTSGLIVVQGSAGSGKTTIGLHRIAYLAFTDPRRFRPDKMLVVVYQQALANYVSRVLPSLDVAGVPVSAFANWATARRQQTFPNLDAEVSESTPAVVMRVKSHAAMVHIIEDRQRELVGWCRRSISEGLAGRGDLAEKVLAAFDVAKGPVDLRVTALALFVKEAALSPADRATVETLGKALRVRTRDVLGEWASLLTDRATLAAGFARYAAGVFSEAQLDGFHRHCVERERLRQNGPEAGPRVRPVRGERAEARRAGESHDELEGVSEAANGARDEGELADEDDVSSSEDGRDEAFTLDAEDDALLLRIHQLQRGPLSGPAGPVRYEHLMVDEVQDFAPIELAVLLDTVSSLRSITLAGDTAQAIAPEHGFSRWSDMLDELGIPHDKVEPLRVSYRSTRQIVDCAEHVLGRLGGDVRPIAPRTGAPVEGFGFGSPGEACESLAKALKDLMREDPSASVALIARHPEQARVYFEVLRRAEVPRLRLVAAQDFTFSPGIDVTDVRQTKGLEFDIVILLDVTADSYPDEDHARRLLHVAMTRGAHQLWVTYTGRPSPLLPDTLQG